MVRGAYASKETGVWTGPEDELLDACNRRILAAERRRGRIADENRRRARRSVAPPHEVPIDAPPLWSQPGLDPYQVRRNRRSIAHSIRVKLQARTYEPFEPQRVEIAKSGGGTRVVSVFPIADEVISLRLFKALLNKNRHASAHGPSRTDPTSDLRTQSATCAVSGGIQHVSSSPSTT
jgi:hypothetical protein